MPPWRATLPLFIVWTVAMAAWLLVYRGSDVTCGPEIYRDCQIGVKVTTGLGRPGIVLLWSLGVVALVMTWLVTRRLRPGTAPRRAPRGVGSSGASVAAPRNRVTRRLPAIERGGAQLAAPVVGQRSRESKESELLRPYADSDGPVPGYRIEGLLSRDPWRHTYEASAPDGRRVALKLFQPRAGEGGNLGRRFRRRIRQRASIEHPNLLPIFDWGQIHERHYVAMGLCKAPTLADLLKAGPIKTTSCLRLLGQLADALETAHERGLIHRELAPESVLVAPRGGGHVLLGDFGAANSERGEVLVDFAEHIEYVPPEQLRDEALTPASNVYSLACILVECLTGSPPYTSELPGMVAYAHASEPPPRLSARRSDLPMAIDDLVAAAMAKDPNERPESARWMVAAAAASLGSESAPPAVHGAPRDPAPEPAPRVGRSKPRRRAGAWSPPRNVVALALAIGAAAAGVLGFTLGHSSGDESPTTAKPTRLPAQREWAAALHATNVALERLDIRRTSARRRLATAPTRRAQAAAAARLVGAYGAAARAVPREFRETARTASALDDARQAYRRLLAAARSGSRRQYAIAARAVRRRERDLQRAIARLSQVRR